MGYGDLPYGDGTYKGESEYNTDILSGVAYSAAKKCLVLGMDEEHGGGWSERSGDNWIWPDSPGSIVTIFSEDNVRYEAAFDSKDGFLYLTDPADTILNGVVYKDKVDPLVADSGYDIDWDIYLGEVAAEKKHYSISNLDLHLRFRPVDTDKYTEDGYDENGLPDDFSVDMELYQDGKQTATAKATDIPTREDQTFERDARGNSAQVRISGNKSAFRLTDIEQYFKVTDALLYSSGSTEMEHQLEMSEPAVWLSRETGITNRATGALLSGTVTLVEGPDSVADSAIRILSPVQMANSAVTGTLLLWHKTGYTISGVTLTQLETYGDWNCSYMSGSIPANVVLGVGDVFEVRLYASTISATALSYYSDNIKNHNGDKFLP